MIEEIPKSKKTLDPLNPGILEPFLTTIWEKNQNLKFEI